MSLFSHCLHCGGDELCVFFFKQKTAYEMRISDWSSDVCSSDLLTSPLAPPMIPVVAIHHSRTHLTPLPRLLTCSNFYFQVEIAAKDNEIGRASCRERVCQYV